jgi:hypothetical protein
MKLGLAVPAALAVIAIAPPAPSSAMRDVALAPSANAAVVDNTAALTWNTIAVTTVRTVVPPAPARFQTEALIYMSYVQAAVYDAVTKIEGRYVPYHKFGGVSTKGASAEAAVAAAARTALNYYLPVESAAAKVESEYTTFLDALAGKGLSAKSIAAGIAVGEAAAKNIITSRSSDGRNATTAVFGAIGPVVAGAWQVVPPATSAQTPWVASMKPFLLKTASQFRPQSPSALSSDTWAKDFNEVKAYGSKTSTVRTTDQTAIAYFWNANVINQENQLYQDIAKLRGMNLVKTARLLAMGEMVVTDSAIACFDAKYDQLFWRPQTAIRNAGLDGNTATDADPDWAPLLNTPNHPEYPSAHGCVTSALGEVLAKVMATRNVNLDIQGSTNGGSTLVATRHFNTVEELDSEIVNARVWIGFHYRHSVDDGIKLGENVANWTLKRYFTQVKAKAKTKKKPKG